MTQQIVQFGANLKDSCRRMFSHDLISNLTDEGFPIWGWNWRFICHCLTTPSCYYVTIGNRAMWTYFCAWTASNMSIARLRFLPLPCAIRLFKPRTSGQPSATPTFFRTLHISSSVGAATRINKVLERIGAMMFAVLFASKISLRLGLYFSIVLLNAACASRVRWSASLTTTTLNRCRADWSTCCVWATSFNKS